MPELTLPPLDRRGRAAWLVLIAGLVPAMLVWYSLRAQDQRNGQQQFELHVREIVDAIEKRLRQHEQILLGGAGLFEASDSVSRDEWRVYIDRLRLTENYPGIQGVGFSLAILPRNLAAHIAAVRNDGFPDYTLRPPGDRDLYTSIIYLEPFTGRNLAAFGYDMFSDATRRRAMTLAAETGKTAISGRVKLVQETHGKPQAGFLMYVPVYAKGRLLDSATSRWQALRGFVYSPYRVNDLMRGILGERSRGIDFAINDGSGASEDTLLYATVEERPAKGLRSPMFSAERRIDAYGQTWTIRMKSRPEFEAQFQSGFEWLVLALGTGVSLLMFALTWSLVGRREQALELANEMTLKIRENEGRLHEVNERFELATDSAAIGVWDYDVISGTLVWDDRMYRLYKVERDEFEGAYAAWSSRLHPEDRERTEVQLQDAIEGKAGYDTTFRIVCRDGEIRHIRAFARVERDQDGRALRMIGVNYDVTSRRQAEDALWDSVRYIQTILDNVLDGIITIDERGTVASFNKGAERIFGYAAMEVAGHNIKMLMPEPYHSQHDGYLRNYVSTGVARIIGIGREVTGQRKNGETFPLDLSVSEISHAGARMFIGLVRDITERKQAERLKSEFVSTVSHELRTPLTSISGALGLLAGGAAGSLPDQAKGLIDIAAKNSQRLILLINDLLDMEKIAAGKLSFDLQVLPIMPLVDQALAANQGYGAQHQVSFVVVERAEDVMVRVDSQRLMQVLSNFLSNAAKYSPALTDVAVAVRQMGAHVRVSVRDRGPGIPAAFRARIFEKFSQADSSDTRQKGGTGLGLAITRELVQRMGGRVGFDSVQGEGATFFFDLPIIDPAQPMTEVDALAAAPHAPRILVVEDEPDIARLLALMLTRGGYQADVAGNAAEALSALERHNYAAITLDLCLPDITGLELFRRIRERPASAQLPVIVISARVEDGRLAISSDLAATDWLQKPVDEQRLLATIDKLMPVASGYRPRVLHVEDDTDLHQVIRAMAGPRFDFELAASLADARALLASQSFDVVLLDLTLPDGSGWELLPIFREQKPAPHVIIFSGTELTPAEAARVEAALLKSQVSPRELLDAIESRIAPTRS